MTKLKILSFFKNMTLLVFLEVGIFIVLQYKFENTLVFEKITLSLLTVSLILVIFGKLNYKRLTFLLLIYITMILLIVNIDRSKSFYLLYWVKNNEIKIVNSEISADSKSKDFFKEISEKDFLSRIKEHESRGLVMQNRGILYLTPPGEFLVSTSNFLSKILKLSGWVGYEK
jgi:hypothetical protein